MKHFDLHECPECGGNGRMRGYLHQDCPECDGRGYLSQEEWRTWCDFRADEHDRHETEMREPSYVDGLMTKFGGGHK